MENAARPPNEAAMTDPTDTAPEAHASGSASPVAPAPGLLATRLQEVFDGALAHTTRTCSYKNFAACFPTPATRRPDVLRVVWQQIIDKIDTKARSEFEVIMNERDVVRGLNELEVLVREAKRRKAKWESEGGERPVAPHTLSPEVLYGAHLAPELEPFEKDLQEKIGNVSAENDRLAGLIGAQKDEVEAMVRQLEATVRDLEDANETLGSVVDERGLRKQVLEIENDLNGSKL